VDTACFQGRPFWCQPIILWGGALWTLTRPLTYLLRMAVDLDRDHNQDKEDDRREEKRNIRYALHHALLHPETADSINPEVP